MNLSLARRHALVCGASSGIGRATAFALASLGAELTVLARREDILTAMLPQLLEAGAPEARVLVADLDQRALLAASIDSLVDLHGPVHIFINNSGGPPGGPLLSAEPEAFELALGRHLLAAQVITRRVVQGMQESGYGRIVNIISTSVREPIPNLGVSNTTRAAVAGWAKSLSRELPAGVTINNVLPGYTDTDRLGALRTAVAERTGLTREQVLEGWIAQVPEGRLGTPEEIAQAVAFLASPAAAYIRGQSLAVDGGRTRSI